ncbi:hypothetical protein RN001_013928 [Aquatica leii]|uniref:Uncharacterized protein n=1 Tax=Aquatica leii TaxID=1421715 RepID=A0AAN7P3G2_9COLE|nr:hypothetical protein RN001_013928 [Aquatica leii]
MLGIRLLVAYEQGLAATKDSIVDQLPRPAVVSWPRACTGYNGVDMCLMYHMHQPCRYTVHEPGVLRLERYHDLLSHFTYEYHTRKHIIIPLSLVVVLHCVSYSILNNNAKRWVNLPKLSMMQDRHSKADVQNQ